MAPSILLIDDDANFRRALRIALRLEGVVAGEATSLEETRKAIDSHPYDCVLVNLLLGTGDIERLLALIRKRLPSAGRIACSVHPEILGTFSLQDPEAVVLEKPFSLETLLQVASPWFVGKERTDRPRGSHTLPLPAAGRQRLRTD